MPDEVGDRLRAARQMVGMSQRELARKTGVTNATISLIESGRTNPSVGSLKRVVAGLGMSLSDFFSFEQPERDKIFYKAEEFTEIGKGLVSLQRVGTGKGQALQMMRETWKAGSDSGKIPLQHDGEECGIIIQGRFEVTVSDQTRVLKAGDAFYFDSRLPHRFRTVGDEDCIVITGCVPPTF